MSRNVTATIVKALALIEDHHVAHGTPSVLEMRDIRTNMTAWASEHATPAEMAHDTLMAMGYRVEMVDGVIYRLEPGDTPPDREN